MDRRSWLWRRKSSEKSPGETESSGSISSPSERFSDDQRSQSPDLTIKAAMAEEDATDDVKTLSEKLSAALLNVSLKEELVKQHAKVAEEAVSGWEKAENEVSALQQKLEASVSKNSTLEDRIGHLDSALKECVRQLRQGREEQDQKIEEAVNRKSNEWEIKKSEFENQVEELKGRLLSAKEEATASVYDEVHLKLEALEKENSGLKFQLLSISEELELRTIERDLSTKAAESASKQHLESIRRLTQLEAECRKLKAMARKSLNSDDQKSSLATQVDKSERGSFPENNMRKKLFEIDRSLSEKVTGNKLNSPSMEINLMDDFLEMEKFAALPESAAEDRGLATSKDSDKSKADELEASLRRVSELEEKVEMVEVEKLQLEMTLDGSRKQIEMLQNRLRDTEGKLSRLKKTEARNQELEISMEEMQSRLNKAQVNFSELETTKAEKLELATCLDGTKKQLETVQNRLKETERKSNELQTLLRLANEAKEAAEMNVKATDAKMEAVESRLRYTEAEAKTLSLKLSNLEDNMETERVLSSRHLAMCQELQEEISKLKCEVELHHEAKLLPTKGFDEDFKLKQEKELAVAAAKFAECQRTIASLGERLKSLATLEDFLLESEDLSHMNLHHPSNAENLKNQDDDESKLPNTESESLNRNEQSINASPTNQRDKEVPIPLTTRVDSSVRTRIGRERFYNRNKSMRRI